MTCRWLICFSFPLMAATVTGKVELRDSREASVRKRLDYSGVVISLNPIKPISRLGDTHVTMRQKDKTFSPHVLAIAAGTYFDFPTADPRRPPPTPSTTRFSRTRHRRDSKHPRSPRPHRANRAHPADRNFRSRFP